MEITLKALIKEITEAEKVSETTARRRIKKMVVEGELIESEHSTAKVKVYKKVEKTNRMLKEKQQPKTGGKKMEMKENFVIGTRDARLAIGSLKKATEAVEAVEAVKGVKEKKDKDGNVTQEAVTAVKAVPAKPATKAVQTVFLIATSEEIANEIIARMADQGFTDANEGQAEVLENGEFRLRYTAGTDKPIRAAFKKCKAKDAYNAPGLALLKEEAKKKAAEEKAKKEAKKEPKGNKKSGKTEEKKEAPAGDASDEAGDEWPA